MITTAENSDKEASHIKYRPTAEELRQLGTDAATHYQVWQGLPSHLKFTPDTSRGGSDSLVSHTSGNYVWVSGKALEAYKQDHKTYFIAYGMHGKRENVKVLTSAGSLDEAIERARILTKIDILERQTIGLRCRRSTAQSQEILASIDKLMAEYRAVLKKYKNEKEQENSRSEGDELPELPRR